MVLCQQRENVCSAPEKNVSPANFAGGVRLFSLRAKTIATEKVKRFIVPWDGIERGTMVKKRFVLLCIALAALFSLCGCSANEKAGLPRLIIGCDDYEPYNYTDEDGEPAGMDVELAQEACRRMGYEPVFRQIDWNNRDELLNSGEIDCLWSCFSMDGAENDYAWVGPYMHSRQVVAVLNDSPIKKLEDLEGKSVAVRVGAKAESIFLHASDDNIPKVETVYSLNTMDEISIALRNNYVDAGAGYAAALREALQNDGVAFRFLDEDLSHASLGVAFAKNGDAALQEKLEKALAEMLADGTTRHILMGYGVEVEKALGGLAHE